MAVKPPRWYFSLRSPYSWLAYRDLRDKYPDVADRIEWWPYWEPDAAGAALLARDGIQLPYVPMSKEKHLYILQDVKRLTAPLGLRVTWPIDKDARWEVSHLGYLLADDAGVGRAYLDRVYRARWEEGLDISDPATLAALAPDLGLDPDKLAEAADDPGLRRRGDAILRQVDRDGVFGVPFFIHRREKFWGCDRLPAFVENLRGSPAAGGSSTGETAGTADPAVPVPALTPAGDAGHAGGCG